MQVLAIVSATLVGLFAGMVVGGLITAGFGAGVHEAGALVGGVAGAVGLGMWVARLVPDKPSRQRRR